MINLWHKWHREVLMKLWLISRMWHESRRQEKIVKGMIIDYQKRAERRKDHYEKMVNIVNIIRLER